MKQTPIFYPCGYRGGGGIDNSQIVTKEGQYSLDACQNNPSIEGSLRNEVNKKVTSGKVYQNHIGKKGIADGEEIEVSLELPEDGFYLVQAWVNACGGGSIDKDSPFFTCCIKNNGNVLCAGIRQAFSINIAKVWDYDNTVMFPANAIQGNITATFKSFTGTQLNTQYDSNFGIRFIKL